MEPRLPDVIREAVKAERRIEGARRWVESSPTHEKAWLNSRNVALVYRTMLDALDEARKMASDYAALTNDLRREVAEARDQGAREARAAIRRALDETVPHSVVCGFCPGGTVGHWPSDLIRALLLDEPTDAP